MNLNQIWSKEKNIVLLFFEAFDDNNCRWAQLIGFRFVLNRCLQKCQAYNDVFWRNLSDIWMFL